MRIREVFGYILAAGGFAVAIVFGVRNSGNEERIGQLEKQLSTAEHRTLEEQQRISRLEAELKAERAKFDALQRERRDDAVAASTAPPPAPPPAPAGNDVKPGSPLPASKKKSGMKKMMEMGIKMQKSPAFKERMRNIMLPVVTAQYRKFFEEAGLPEDVRKAVVEKLLDRNDAMQEIGTLLMDENITDEEIVRRQEEAFAKAREWLAPYLTPDQIAQMEIFEKGLTEKARHQAVEKEIEPFGLEPWRREQARAIILEEEEKNADGAPDLNSQMAPGGRLTLEGIHRMRETFQGNTEGLSEIVASMKESNERIFLRIQPILSAEQYEAFKKKRESVVSTLENSIQMFKIMEAAGEEEPKKE